MSVHTEKTATGITYKVKWRENGRQRSKNFNPDRLGGQRAARRMAGRFDEKMAALAASGDFSILDRGKQPFDEYLHDSWYPNALATLAASTMDGYASVIDLYLIPDPDDPEVTLKARTWMGVPLRDIKPRGIEDWMRELLEAGVGAATVRKACAVMSSVLKRAHRDEEIDSNPALAAEKPSAPRQRKPVMITPLQVEVIRANMIAAGRLGDAMLVSVLAYAGPRPESEVLPLEWIQVGTKTVEFIATKSGEPKPRHVEMLAPLKADLRAWQKKTLTVAGLVFPQAGNGVARPRMGNQASTPGPWSESDWDAWRDRVFRGSLDGTGLPADVRPRDLRSSFVTLLVHGGYTVRRIADDLGHLPTQTLNTYMGIFNNFDPADIRKPADWITDARKQVAAGVRYCDKCKTWHHPEADHQEKAHG